MIQNFFCGITVGCLVGFALHWIFRTEKLLSKKLVKVQKSAPGIDNEKSYRLALIINNELKMGKGKVIAQCAHATVGVYENFYWARRINFDTWEHQGKPVSVLKVSDSSMLIDLQKIAAANNMVMCMIADAGRTQIPRGSITVLAIGPENESKLKNITENLLPYT